MEAKSAMAPSPMKSPLVLVVDDQKVNLDLITLKLGKRSFDTLAASSGSEALKEITSRHVDIVLLDMMMPDMDGIQTLAEIRKTFTPEQLPVIMISAQSEEGPVIEAIKNGANDYITKPIDFAILFARVNHQLTMSHAIQEAKNAKLLAQREQAEKNDFMATISHEIRTPLSAILGASEMLSQEELPEEMEKPIKIIQSAGELLKSLVDDLLDLSKIKAGKLEIEEIPFSMDQLVEDTLCLFRPTAVRKNIDLTHHFIPKRIPHQLLGDPVRIRQILVNFLSNALKFTFKGKITLEIQWHQTGDSIALSLGVRDTGIGIAKDRLANIFTPYTQAESSTTRRFGGTGLGLTICRQLSTLMGGEIKVESTEGEGSFFQILLKLKTCSALEEASPPKKPKSFAGLHKDQAKTLVVVDDNPANLLVTAKMCEVLGHRVLKASSGKEAIELIQNQAVDIALIDGQMPEMDGFETATAIRNLNLLKPPRLIAMTGLGLSHIKQSFDEAGFDDYLGKPVSLEELVTKLSTDQKEPELKQGA